MLHILTVALVFARLKRRRAWTQVVLNMTTFKRMIMAVAIPRCNHEPRCMFFVWHDPSPSCITCMYVCIMYVCIIRCVCMHMHMYGVWMYACAFMYVCMYACTYTEHTHTHTHTSTHPHIHTHHVRAYLCTYIYIRMTQFKAAPVDTRLMCVHACKDVRQRFK
jgi:hypothetical protein